MTPQEALENPPPFAFVVLNEGRVIWLVRVSKIEKSQARHFRSDPIRIQGSLEQLIWADPTVEHYGSSKVGDLIRIGSRQVVFTVIELLDRFEEIKNSALKMRQESVHYWDEQLIKAKEEKAKAVLRLETAKKMELSINDNVVKLMTEEPSSSAVERNLKQLFEEIGNRYGK